MAIKSADQITILDVTDAYSIMLTSEAFVFTGDTNGIPAGATCKTQALALCGSKVCQNVTIGNIVCPSGISSTIKNNSTANPEIIFTTKSTITTSCEATIPISVDDVVINKKFTFAVATKGHTGETGADGADAITIIITSSNGTIFKNNSGSTVLTAHVFKGAVEQSITDAGVCGSLGSIKWYKQGSTTAIKTSKTLTVSASDVTNSVVYTAQLEN